MTIRLSPLFLFVPDAFFARLALALFGGVPGHDGLSHPEFKATNLVATLP